MKLKNLVSNENGYLTDLTFRNKLFRDDILITWDTINRRKWLLRTFRYLSLSPTLMQLIIMIMIGLVSLLRG